MSGDKQTAIALSEVEKKRLLERVSPDFDPLVELAALIGLDGIEAVMGVYGSQKPHIPRPLSFWHKLARAVRNDEIRDRFNGRNYGELAAEYSGFLGLGTLGERQVREIVHASPKKRSQRGREDSSPVKVRRPRYGEIAALAQQSNTSLAEVTDSLLDAALHSPEVRRRVQSQLQRATLKAVV